MYIMYSICYKLTKKQSFEQSEKHATSGRDGG